MNKLHTPNCPECNDSDGLARRDFLRAVGGGAAALGIGSPLLAADTASKADAPKASKPAEDLIRELFASLDDKQKETLVLPFNHGGENGAVPTRMRTYNAAALGRTIGKSYTKAQSELVERILKAILSGDEQAFTRISRDGTWDGSKAFENCSALIFGNPNDKGQFAWQFAGHHLTVRCDGNSEPGAAFGGPMYYGHSVSGYNPKNVWFYQTKKALDVFDSLNDKQKEKAIVKGNPGDANDGLKPRNPQPGIELSELSADQLKLVEQVMRSVLDPFRKEDGDEVMDIVKSNGGQGKIHLAFYTDGNKNVERWDYWRLEGPGFVWNYRVLPHVHTYVNIKKV